MATALEEDGTKELEVMVKSATVEENYKGNNVYVKVRINEKTSINTTNNTESLGCPRKLSWNNKFVFPIPHTIFFDDEKSVVVFEFFRARKTLPDTLLWTAACHVQPLFKKIKEEEKEREEKSNLDKETKPKYDDSSDEEEIKEVVDKKEEKLITVEAQKPMISKSFGARVFKGLEVEKGFLDVEMVVGKKKLNCVGNSGWGEYGMEEKELSMIEDKYDAKKKKNHNNLWCFSADMESSESRTTRHKIQLSR